MDVSREELAARFREMSDEELLGRLEYDLTPLAKEVVVAELESRGIEPALATETLPDDESAALTANDSRVELVTVATYWNVMTATLACACLQSCGIDAYIWGSELARADVILAGVTAGGARVQVRSDQYEEAKEILAAYERGEMTPPPDESESPVER